jgi:hypothetical protein
MTTATLLSVEELCRYVRERLCAHEDLDARYTPLYRTLLRKQDRPCGMFFHLQGPRLVKAYAVWTSEENRLLFYDGQGRRFAETVLSEGPDLAALP